MSIAVGALLTMALAAAAEETYDLARAVERAIEANRTLRIQAVEEEKAGAKVREAWAGAFPRIDFFGTMNRNLEVQSTFIQTFGGFGGETGADSTGDKSGSTGSEIIKLKFGADYDYLFNVRLRQPLWLGGKVGAAVRAARAYNRSTKSGGRAVMASVVLQTKILFYTALLSGKVIDVFEAARDRAERHLESVRLKRDHGLVSDFELLRARVARAGADPPLIEARNRYEKALNKLKVDLALPLEEAIEVRGELDFTPVPERILDERGAAAVETRHDRKALEFQAKLSEQALRAARGDRYPNFYLLGAYSLSGASDDLRFNSDERATASSASIEVSLPLWTSGATTAKIRQARADYAIARLRLELLDEQIREQVTAARLDLESAQEQVEANREAFELAHEAYEIAESRYENGLLSQIDLLDVNDTLTEARINLLRSLFTVLTARANWENTVGIDWGETW